MAIEEKVIEQLYSSLIQLAPHVTSRIMLRVDITEDCDLYCANCNKLCGVAKSKAMLTIEQLEKFMDEMKTVNCNWPLIFLTGGEPTIHPQFTEIVDKFDAFCKNWSKSAGFIITNKENQPKEFLRDRVVYSTFHGVAQSRIMKKSIPILQAPIDYFDYGNENWRKGCITCDTCGPCFSRYGYYMCPIANSIDRIFGFDLGAKSYKEFTFKKIFEQRETFCKYCGYFFTNLPDYNEVLVDHDKISISPTWQTKLEEHSVNPKQLTLY